MGTPIQRLQIGDGAHGADKNRVSQSRSRMPRSGGQQQQQDEDMVQAHLFSSIPWTLALTDFGTASIKRQGTRNWSWHSACCGQAMETLTPELERRLQIEELWARRLVLCDAINQARLDRYHGRRALLCLNRAYAEPAALQASQPETTKGAAAVVEKPALEKTPQRARSALVQGLCGAAAAALIIVGAMIEDPQASIIRAQSFVASLVHPWGTAPQVRSEDQADLDEDTADTPPSFPDLHREVSQKLPHPLPAGANSR